MGMLSDAVKGVEALLTFAIWLASWSICAVGMGVLIAVCFGVVHLDSFWKVFWVIAGVYGVVRLLAYFGSDRVIP